MTKSAERVLFERRVDALAKHYLSSYDNDVVDLPSVADVGEMFKQAILDNTKGLGE